jgi:OOP family OmpA-OmpF porin
MGSGKRLSLSKPSYEDKLWEITVKLRIALIAATSFAMPLMASSIAHAQQVTGPYFSLGGGVNLETSQKLKDGVVNATPIPGNTKVGQEAGYTVEGSAGYGFGNGIRVELEGDYYNNRFSKTPSGAGTLAAGSGRSEKYGAMVNGLYDFDLGSAFVFPYIGLGVGYQEADFNNFSAGSSVGRLYASQSKASFAGQIIAGLSFPVSYVPGLSITAEYRYMALFSARKYHGTFDNIPSSFKTQNDYNNSFLLGARYQLFQPPAPPPPPAPAPVAAPAPAPAKTYLVFFDWDKYSLTPRALDIISQAASDSKTQQTTTIAVNGYTDTSGTPVYNQGLSVRRAKAVAAQLVTDGVPASEITAQGFGDTNLLVPTGAGVREPQNRRVQIVLQ